MINICILNVLLNDIHRKMENVDSIYEYPNDSDFHLLKFTEVDWPTAKDGNFFNIIRILAIRGPISLSGLANLYVDGDHPYDSVYQIFYRLLNGSANKKIISLQTKGVVNKKGNLFLLSPFGVLYAIHVFHMNKYYNKEYNQFTKTDDFSYQKDINGIFDVIKKHYSYFSLFFDNLDYIKENKHLDINIFFNIISSYNILDGHSFYNFYKPLESDFSSQLEEMIPFIFYHSAAMNNLLHTNKAFKFNNSIISKLSKTSNSILKNMKEDFEIYRDVNSQLF